MRTHRFSQSTVILATCIVALSFAFGATAATAQVWDLATDFSEDNNPNDAWAYFHANGGEPLLATVSGAGGAPGGWSGDGTNASVPNLFVRPWSNIQSVCEVGGHGPWEARWTSPLDGPVTVTFGMLQLFEQDRRMAAEIRLNGIPIERALVPEHANGKTKRSHEAQQGPNSNPSTRMNSVEQTMVLEVEAGDTLGLAAVGGTGPEGGNGVDTFVNVYFTITAGDVARTCPENCNNGVDDDGDGNADCLDDECKCNTLEDSTINFPTSFAKEMIVEIQGVTTEGHTYGSNWRPLSCPFFFVPGNEFEAPPWGEVEEALAGAPPPDEPGIENCWAVESTAEFTSATLTLEVTASDLDVTEDDADAAVMARMNHVTGTIEFLDVVNREVIEGIGEWTVTITSTVPDLERSTFAIVVPDTLPELDCDDGVDNDGDGDTDCDDINCSEVSPCAELDCSDNIDNDEDGDTDCDDFDCFTDLACEEICDNGIDDDFDGLTDCDDQTCDLNVLCHELDCGDNTDNDGDGDTDCADTDCATVQPCVETACDDGVDNDGNGDTDCDDDNCLGVASCLESGNCDDGVDNDGDGDVDCADGDCLGAATCVETDCVDTVDNDADGDIDCADSDCASDAACRENNCDDGVDDEGDGATDCADSDCEFEPPCCDPVQTYYRFEEGDGVDVFDSISEESHGTHSATYSTDVPFDTINGEANASSLSFVDGTAANMSGSFFILHDPADRCAASDVTLEWFMKPQDQSHVGVFWTIDGGGDANRYNIHFQSDGLGADYREENSNLHSALDNRVPLAFNEWSHIACVRTTVDGGGHQYEWYVNGELMNTQTDEAPALPTVTTWTISGRNGCCNMLNALMDEVRMTPEALTPDLFLSGPTACVPTGKTETVCDDGIDDDCDGLLDDADDDCQVGVGPFIRGDCDGNGTVGGSPTEAIVLLNFSFRGGPAPGCLAACDAEANGSLGITDALRILRHSFLGVGEPDAPFPNCVVSDIASDVDLGCETPIVCPQ